MHRTIKEFYGKRHVGGAFIGALACLVASVGLCFLGEGQTSYLLPLTVTLLAILAFIMVLKSDNATWWSWFIIMITIVYAGAVWGFSLQMV